MAKEFKPRHQQKAMIDGVTQLPRCNIFASPGTGKTSAVLCALDIRNMMGDDIFPVLVTGPMRVVNTVWSTEMESWAQFKKYTYSKILGTPKQRRDALAAKADFYFINTENLLWLDEHLTKELGVAWPFNTVIVDESTRIKNHRCSRVDTRKRKDAHRFKVRYMFSRGGSKNPSALMKHATKTRYWVNLTGTPTPNGVKDIWGQHWPMDFGAALGETFTEFKERWFVPEYGSSAAQERIRPLPHSEDEILDLIAPYTVTVDSATLVDKPNVVRVLTELPDSLRKRYRELAKDAYLQLVELEKEATVTGVNAGALAMKLRQFAAGSIINDQGGTTQVHSLKIEALKELRETLGDTPIIVAYHFRSDLEAIQKAFPKAVLLPKGSKQKEVEDKWNSGKISMLLLHPQSAGHGLNLQYGGNIMVIYTPDWNAEYYEQVIERIGPMRQKQAGLDRPVWIYRLEVKGTIDTTILAAIDGKMEVSQSVKDYLLTLGEDLE